MEPHDQQHQNGERHQAHQAELGVQHGQQHRGTDQREHRGDQAVEAGFQHVLDCLDVVGGPTHHPAGGVPIVKCDVQLAEMTEYPPTQFEQHLLAGAARATQEIQSADRLHHHHPAQRRDDRHQRRGRPALEQRRDAVVDALLHQKRNRQPCNVFHYDDDGQESDRPPVGPKQRAQQRASLTLPWHRLVDGQVALLVELAAPIGCRLLLGRRRHSLSSSTSRCSRARSSSSRHVQSRSAPSSSSSSAASRYR